uniref:Inactive ubiquitin carboxyl-terminal hydrolase 54 n=1 Tax=Sipha flava TaxID=143950 RepID=A0A2S2QTX9_9HEMI
MPPSRDSMAYTKGLLNGPGQNNCFLNSAVQVLWHLDIFRRSFRELYGHACMEESCIFCALKELFTALGSSQETALPPDALRKALAQSFYDQRRFQLGYMDDAAECFENILLRIHYHIANEEAEDMCNAKHCISHQKFAMTLVEQSVCGACGATSEPLPFTQMVHYVSASALTAQVKQYPSTGQADLFGQLLKKAGGMGDIRDCPSACGAKIQIRRTLMNRPEIVSVGIVWDSDRPTLDHIMALLSTLRTSLRLCDVFHGSFDLPNGSMPLQHQLVGVVTYYGKHYSTFFYHTKLKIWIYFDDANVREIGPKWEQVVEKCKRGRYQPLLLLFASPEGEPVDATTAPKTITKATKLSFCTSSAQSLSQSRRSLTPNPEKPLSNQGHRRAITPNPDPTIALAKPGLNSSINEYQNLAHYQTVIMAKAAEMYSTDDLNDQPSSPRSVTSKCELVRRDSGNWSGDRNSASSSSSTSLENPYQYFVGKIQNRIGNGFSGVPRSPNKSKDYTMNQFDLGYDSYSLSSNDSLPLQQNLKHNLQLAQIPEGHQTSHTSLKNGSKNSAVDEVERLCAEADQLLGKSEASEDLVLALSLCNLAAGKARAAMDAPYSNPQVASFARMKHNTCVMRARSLHKRLEEPLHSANKHGEGRHSREGSSCSNRGSQGSHSRQNSKDKTVQHSRQNSKELLDMSTQLTSLQSSPVDKSVKNIEIYATLPKNKKGLLSRSSNKTKQVIEDEEYMISERPGRSLQTKSKSNKKEGEKRARSEERGTKNTKEFVSNSLSKETKKPKVEEKEIKQGKKQHKIRRKLLMGGLIKRKNRSMPDLREDELQLKDPPKEKIISKDDSMVDSISSQSSLSGYLSEGHLESTGNPNLLRSKLMRKSFYTNKFLHFAKVPPPPPMRTSSQLSKTENNKQQNEWLSESQSLPYIHSCKEDVTYANGGMLLDKDNKNVMITQAQVHHNPEQNAVVNNVDDLGFPLPPYPSPLNSVCHSRQPSEEFPPPPPPPPPPPVLAVDEVDGVCPLMPMAQVKNEEEWVKELQLKQSAWSGNDNVGQDLDSKSIVKDLKNKFEQKSIIDNLITHAINNLPADGICETVVDEEEKKIEKELKGALSKTSFDNNDSKRKSGKKKNVTFCEQVVLVATAEEDEVDSYIPNPILERVLRSVLHKDTPVEQNREVTKSVIPLKRNDSGQFNRSNLSLKSYENNITEEKSNTEVKEELPPKAYRMSPVQQPPQTLSPIVQPKLKAPLPEQIQKPVESVKNYRMSPIQQTTPLNQSPLTQQKFKSPSSSQIANTMSNLSINSLDSIQSVQNQSLTTHKFYSNAQQTSIYPQQYQSLSPMGHQKSYLNNESHSLSYQQMNESKSSCSPVNSRSNQSSLERNQTTRQVNGVPSNCYPQQSPVDGRSGHFRYNGDNQTQHRFHGNQMSNLETNTQQYQTNPGSPRTLHPQKNLQYNVSNMEASGQHQNNENRSYNHGQTPQYQSQPHERLNNNNPSHLIDNRTCYPHQPSPVQVQHNNNNVQHQMSHAVSGDNRSTYIQTQQFDRLNTTHLNHDKTGFVQQGSPVTQQSDRLNNVSQYNSNCENNKTGYLQQGLSPNQAQQLERMAQHYENKTGGYIQQGLPINQSQQFANGPLNNNVTGDNKTNNLPQSSPSYTQNESRTSFPPQCSPIPPVSPHQTDNRPPGYPRNNVDVKMSPLSQHSPGMLQRQRSMVNGFHSMPYTRPDNVAHLPPAHPKKDLQSNFPRSQGETHSSSSLDRKQLQQHYSNQQDGNNPTLPSKNRPVNSVQRTSTVRRPMTVYEPQQLPPYQHPPAPVAFKQQQPRPNSQPRATTPNGTTVPANDPSRYTVYQQPPSPRLQDKCNMSRPSPCNLCRKKAVNHPSIYCSDCDFYMSRFKPKAQSTTC